MKSLKIAALVLGLGSLGLGGCGSDSKKMTDAAVVTDGKAGADTGGTGGSGGDGGGTGGTAGTDGGSDATTDAGDDPGGVHAGIINAPAAGTVTTQDVEAFTSHYVNGACN